MSLHFLLTPSWLSHLFSNLAYYNFALDISLPRYTSSITIIDFLAKKVQDKRQLLRLNRTRISLKLIFIDDLYSIDGQRLLTTKEAKSLTRTHLIHWPVYPLPRSYLREWTLLIPQLFPPRHPSLPQPSPYFSRPKITMNRRIITTKTT